MKRGFYMAAGIKIDKIGNFEFKSGIDLAALSVKECVIAAYRDIGRLILKRARLKLPKRRGYARKNLSSWVRRQEGDLVLGYKRRVKGFYAMLFEIGAKNVPELAVLTKTVEGSENDILEIFSRYLKTYLPELKVPQTGSEDEEVND
jgi:hypothetical protein